MKVLREQLKTLKTTAPEMRPDREWVVATRSALFQKIQRDVATEKSSLFGAVVPLFSLFDTSRLNLFLKGALALVLVFGVTISGWVAGVSASYNSLPGDFLYNVKLATEKTQVAVANATGDSETAIDLQFDFAERRVKEIEKVSAEPHRVAAATRQLEKGVVSAKDTLQDVQQSNPDKAASLAKNMTERTTVLVAELKVATDQADTATTQNTLLDVKKVVSDANVEAIGVLSAKDPEQAKNLVTQKVEQILRDAATAKATVEEVKKVSDAATSTLAVVTTSSPSTTIMTTSSVTTSMSSLTSTATGTALSSSSTNELGKTSSTTGEILTKAVAQVGQTVGQLQEVARQVQELVQGNKLSEAVEQLKVLNTFTKTNDQTLAEVKDRTVKLPAPVIAPVQPVSSPETGVNKTP